MRPEGWETLKAKNLPLHCFFPDKCVGQSFEAGADAILEALRERGKHFDKDKTHDGFEWHDTNAGTLVWIPDDKEVKNAVE